jgi:metallophosphoesterase superfamily enzyme
LTLRHIPEPDAAPGEVSGHLHPCAKIKVSGRCVRKPCFASDGKRLILPSFGAYTGGINLREQAFAGLFDKTRLTAFMLGSRRVFPVAAAQLV